MIRAIQVFFLFSLLLCRDLPCSAASPPLVLNVNAFSSALNGHIDILEDKSETLTINDVTSPEMDGLFKPPVESRGFTSRVYWIRFAIKNEAETEQRWLLELNIPNIRYLDLYVQTAGGRFNCMQSGIMRPMSIRTFQNRHPVFPVVIDGPARTFYLRGVGDRSAIMSLTAWTPEAFSRMDHRRDLIAGCYFGAMIVMFAYNLFIFLSLRDRAYLYYILDIFCFALYVFLNKGFLSEFISPEMVWIFNYTFILALLPIFTGVAFCRNFLATFRNTPFLDGILKIYILVVALLVSVLFVLSPELMVRALTVITPCGSLLVLTAGIVCLIRGYRPAHYFVAARTFRFLGMITFVLALNNILPWNLLTMSGLQIGSLLEVLLLSFALADRINIMRREKEEAQADAVRSSHLAVLGELAAGVAHEINTPVNTIINSADLILENEERKDTEHDVDVIKKQGRRIATIVQSLLFFSRSPAEAKVPFSLAEMVHGTLDLVGATLRKENVKLTIQIPSGLMDVIVHPQQIEQVFLNILTNAMHALEERFGDAHDKKTLEIVASEIYVDNRPYVRVAFLDNGIGIPAALLNTVTKSFVTTKKSGTGLGLSISRQIIENHGGGIGLESRVGAYTKVSIDLPGIENI